MSEYRSPESDLYPIVESFLNIQFTARVKPPLGTHLPLVAITDKAGPVASGVWSRPDLAMINVWRHKYQPGQTLDLYGFEVKRDEACDLKSVHETLAHRRLVHFAYLVWNYRKADFSAEPFKVIYANCDSYGLGLITFADKNDGRSFEMHLDAERATPRGADVDDFIESRFPDHQRTRLLDWIGAGR